MASPRPTQQSPPPGPCHASSSSLALAEEFVQNPPERPPGRSRQFEYEKSGVEADPSGCLADDLETEVIPRLLLAHRTSRERSSVPDPRPQILLETSIRARQAAQLAISGGVPAVIRFVDELAASDEPTEQVLCDILGGAARYLGVAWENDDLDFIDVTIGVSVLKQSLHQIATQLSHGALGDSAASPIGRVAFAPSGGEQHTFGLLLVEEIYRSYGWQICSSAESTAGDLLKIASRMPLDVVGLTLSTSERLDQLTAEIDNLRSTTCSSGLTVLVGGHAFIDKPELYKLVGADAVATDAIEAVRIGERIVRGGNARLDALSRQVGHY